MDRIRQQTLELLCARINRVTGSPEQPYVRDAQGKLIAQIGNYHLDYAYGGVNLVRMHSEGGGITTPLSCGCIAKRDLYNRMHAFLAGLEAKGE